MLTIAGVLVAFSGAALCGYAIIHFDSIPWLGFHLREPYPVYFFILTALFVSLGGFKIATAIERTWNRWLLYAISFIACATIVTSGAYFLAYLLKGTLNPDFTLKLGPGDLFPSYSLPDQHGKVHSQAELAAGYGNLVFIYRGAFCPYARMELKELTARQKAMQREGLGIIGISAGPASETKRLADSLETTIPLLSDESGRLLDQLGLLDRDLKTKHPRAIPAFFIIDGHGMVRWYFTSIYFRELPAPEAIMKTAAKLGVPK